jgi:hypothetical protein
MTTELHEGPLEPSRILDAPASLSWRQKRELRRRRRVWFEEILGWILVPVIIFGCYWLLNLTLGMLGTSLTAIMDGISAITANL